MARAIITGDWNTMKNAGIAFATTFVFSGFNPIAATAAFLTTIALDNPIGQGYIKFQAEEINDDILGMRPKAAYITAYVTTNIGLNIGFETMLSSMVAAPVAGQRPYDPSNPQDKALTDNPKGYDSFGRFPGREGHAEEFTNSQSRTLTDKNNNVLAVTGIGKKSGGLSRLGLDAQHTGAIVKDFSGQGMKPIAPKWMYASLYGTCQQATNATLLAGGLSDTVFSLYPHWSTFASTAIYGNYGGGLVRSVVGGIQANESYKGD